MDRLTERDEFGNADIIGVDSMDLQCNLEFDKFNRVTNALNKLAEYEDLEERLRSVYGECSGLLEMVIENLEQHENIELPESVFKARLLTDGEVDRWEEFKELDKQGKLLRLPAAIGDEIFFIFMDCLKDYKEEYCRDHEGSCENCHHRVPEIVSRDFRMPDILNMNNIFTKREEAEAALKGVRGCGK